MLLTIMIAINDKLKDHILESIGEGVFTVDKNFRINFFNKAAERITGYKREEVVGRFCKHVFRSKLCYSDCPIGAVLKANRNIYDFESNIITKEGVTKPIKLNSAVLQNDSGDPFGGIVTFRDISELFSLKKSLMSDTQFHGIVGQSKEMREIFDLIEEIADCDAPVLVNGESGTGKEMIVNAIQKLSPRRDKPFVKINCSVFPPHLLASELFGHVKGAFTDAVKDRIGRFEMADGGTIFLDEIGEMPLHMQPHLLRVLQEGNFERVGESITRKVDVRIVSATNIDIEKALREGKFREDLYYRLNVIPIKIPPLRERKEDIIPLVNHFLKKLSTLYKKKVIDIDPDALDILLQYDWPGNIRELENVIEYSFIRTKGNEVIDINKLPDSICKLNGKPFGLADKYKEEIVGSEAAKIYSLLEKHKWNKSKVAKDLNIGRTTLWRRMKRYGIVE